MSSHSASSGRSRLAAILVAAVLALVGLPISPAAAEFPVPLPGVEAGQQDHIRGYYEYADFDHLKDVEEPASLSDLKLKDFGEWDAIDPRSEKAMFARWKRYLVEKQVDDWESWRFFYLEKNRKNADSLMSTWEPTPSELAQVIGEVKSYPAGSRERMIATWRDGIDAKNSAKWRKPSWKTWRTQYINVRNSKARGSAEDGFEKFFKKEYFAKEGLLDKGDFKFGQQVPDDVKAKLPPDMVKVNRPLDAADFTYRRVIFELKSGKKLGSDQWDQLDDLLKIAKAAGCELVYIFGEQPDQKAIDEIERRADAAGVKIAVRLFRAVAQKQSSRVSASPPRAGPAPRASASVDLLTPPGQYSADSGFKDMINASPESQAEAEEVAQIQQDLAADGSTDPAAARADLGGVDFSTLELRYVSDTGPNGASAQYAFRADALPADQESFGGKRAAQLVSDSFFVWLELAPDKFWVNLGPDEPDRIIDEQFGKTDAGRVLLEADLQMKKTVAKLIHPDNPEGQRYWDSLQGDNKCVSMRQWIVPDPAVVRDSGDELFILDTPLQVKMETMYAKAQGAAQVCDGKQDPAATRHNEEVYRTTILPQVQDAVNHAPEYADLRRVYASRVAAEWFRQRSATKHTAYSDLIGKGDISAWQSRELWSPKEVHDRYVQSYKNGEFNITRTTTEGNTVYTRTYLYGGVDFSHVDRDQIDADKFAKDHPTLAAAAKNALQDPSSDGRNVWAGGLTTSEPLTEAPTQQATATAKPLWFILMALPLAAWLLTGAWLLRRRRRVRVASSTGRA